MQQIFNLLRDRALVWFALGIRSAGEACFSAGKKNAGCWLGDAFDRAGIRLCEASHRLAKSLLERDDIRRGGNLD